MERETKIIITPVGKHRIEVKSYLIGREKRALTSVYLRGNLSYNIEDKDVKGIQGNIVEEAENLAWRTIIVSIDGIKENDVVEGKPFSTVEAILNMRAEDYSFIVKEVNSAIQDKDYEEKKTE